MGGNDIFGKYLINGYEALAPHMDKDKNAHTQLSGGLLGPPRCSCAHTYTQRGDIGEQMTPDVCIGSNYDAGVSMPGCRWLLYLSHDAALLFCYLYVAGQRLATPSAAANTHTAVGHNSWGRTERCALLEDHRTCGCWTGAVRQKLVSSYVRAKMLLSSPRT